jgi:hypothetical protein
MGEVLLNVLVMLALGVPPPVADFRQCKPAARFAGGIKKYFVSLSGT